MGELNGYISIKLLLKTKESSEWLESLEGWWFRIAGGVNMVGIGQLFLSSGETLIKTGCDHVQEYQARKNRDLQLRDWSEQAEGLAHRGWRSGCRPWSPYGLPGVLSYLTIPSWSSFFRHSSSIVHPSNVCVLRCSTSQPSTLLALRAVSVSAHSLMFQLPCVFCWAQKTCSQLRPCLSINPSYSAAH